MTAPSTAALCFPRAAPRAPGGPPLNVRLKTAAAEAVATLVPLLGCGEEAAALAFDGLARAGGAEASALTLIADEERVHDALLRRVSASLPAVDRSGAMLRAARRFHINLGRGGAALHLGRIAAIDAAVCTILSRLIRPETPIAADHALRPIFARIHRDEAKHVRVSRTLASTLMPAATLREYGAAARGAMAAMLATGGDAFEALAVDPDALLRDVARLPNGLYA